ncbi:MAG: hypothetical protein KFW09_01845 [Oscillospiraceae bacterium]|nr:hypothetical protein [Oscillospiraceae bacterium]
MDNLSSIISFLLSSVKDIPSLSSYYISKIFPIEPFSTPIKIPHIILSIASVDIDSSSSFFGNTSNTSSVSGKQIKLSFKFSIFIPTSLSSSLCHSIFEDISHFLLFQSSFDILNISSSDISLNKDLSCFQLDFLIKSYAFITQSSSTIPLSNLSIIHKI